MKRELLKIIINWQKIIFKDGNGQISKKELKELFINIEIDDQSWNKVIQSVDTDKDGQISL